MVGAGDDEAAERLDEVVRLFFLGGMTADGEETLDLRSDYFAMLLHGAIKSCHF